MTKSEKEQLEKIERMLNTGPSFTIPYSLVTHDQRLAYIQHTYHSFITNKVKPLLRTLLPDENISQKKDR